MNIRNNIRQLRRSVQQLALPAEQQLSRLQGFEVAFEVADDFGNWCGWALADNTIVLTNEQRNRLEALNVRLNKMSGEHNVELWTDDALLSHSEWETVRIDARKVLELFEWPIQDTDDTGVEIVVPPNDDERKDSSLAN